MYTGSKTRFSYHLLVRPEDEHEGLGKQTQYTRNRPNRFPQQQRLRCRFNIQGAMGNTYGVHCFIRYGCVFCGWHKEVSLVKKWRYAANTVTAVTAPYIKRNENTQQPAQRQRKADSVGSPLGPFLFEAAKNLASPALHPYMQYQEHEKDFTVYIVYLFATKRSCQVLLNLLLNQSCLTYYLTCYLTCLT